MGNEESSNELVRLNLELDKLKRELRVKADSEDQMKQVLREYEKTISDLIIEKENEKKKMDLDIESALAEKNEEQLKNFVEEYKEKLQKADKKYNLLKSHAEERLEDANIEIEKIRSGQDNEKVKLNAIVQKTEMKVRNLERTLAQKTKENEELTKICDELIAKVGP